MKKFLFILLIGFYPLFAIAQLQVPGKPAARRFGLKSTPPVVRLNHPASQKLLILKKTNTPQPLYAGYIIPLVDNVLQKGDWQQLPNGNFVWRLEIHLDGASALNLYLRNIKLGQKDRLFIYNSRKGQLLGAFSKQNNGKEMGTAFLLGSNLVLELDSPKKYDILPFELTGVGNITNHAGKSLKDFGDAGTCEIPVNCPEGRKTIKNQKNSVARILLREGSGLFWCTGSLINDTKSDGKPYFLTANHCGDISTTADYARMGFLISILNHPIAAVRPPNRQYTLFPERSCLLLLTMKVASDFKSTAK